MWTLRYRLGICAAVMGAVLISIFAAGLCLGRTPAEPVVVQVQGSNPDCQDLAIGSDDMGLRVRDHRGIWRYVMIDVVLVARLPGWATPTPTPRDLGSGPRRDAVWAHAANEEDLQKYFGECASVYGPILARQTGLVDFTTSGYKVKSLGRLAEPPNDNPRGVLSYWETQTYGSPHRIEAEFFVLDGTDLLVVEPERRRALYGPSIYAVDESREATPLIGATAQEREKMTGVVRQIADALSEKGAKRIQRFSADFKQGKLEVQIQLKGGTKETFTIAEQ